MTSVSSACDLLLMQRVGDISQQKIRTAELQAVAKSASAAATHEALVSLLMACEPHLATCAGLRQAALRATHSLPPGYREAITDWMQGREDARQTG
jgi:hypothetical protein